MKNVGVTRKIDELGRIVIPIELRKNLNIKPGDDLEIYIENNLIIMEKFSHLLSLKSESDSLINSIDELIKSKVYITDKEKIITKGDLENVQLPKELVFYLNERRTYESQLKEKLCFGNIIKESYFYVLPIIQNSDAMGLIIIEKSDKLEKEDLLFAKLLKNIIENNKNIC